MTEARLQHDFVMWFRQTWPEYSHLLFMVHNEAKSKKEASYLKSMGLVSGAADLALIVPRTGTFCGLELKAPGSIHSKEHIEQQLNWGELIVSNGGYYIMTNSLIVLKKFATCIIDNNILTAMDVARIEKSYIKKQFVNKTIKF